MTSPAIIVTIFIALAPFATAKPTDAFVELTKQPYYIDKTDLLHVLSHFHNNYNFIASPNRFLKSSNLQMIKSFYQFEFDENGNHKPFTDTETYAFFKNFKIYNHSKVVLENRMANHPVLLIDLKFNVSEVNTISDIDTLLNTRLREAFQEYFEVLPKLPKPTGAFEITKFETEFMQKLQNGTANQFELTYGLYRLSNVLHKYFKRRVIILVDDYDYAANQAILNHNLLLNTDGAVYYFYTTINNMFRKTFKANRQFKNYAMMTGISGRIEYADNEVTENQFLDEHVFTPYFGFTEIEVDHLLTRYNCVYTTYNQVKSYYRGYLTRLENESMYSPHSIVQYALAMANPELKLQPYWFQSENHDFLKEAIKSESFRQKLHEMAFNAEGNITISSYHKSSPTLDTFVRTINERKSTFKGIHQLDDEHLFHHLLETGYLTHRPCSYGPEIYTISNWEIREGLRDFFERIDIDEIAKNNTQTTPPETESTTGT